MLSRPMRADKARSTWQHTATAAPLGEDHTFFHRQRLAAPINGSQAHMEVSPASPKETNDK